MVEKARLKGQIIGLYFNVKQKDEQGNFIQPVVVIESKNEKYRVYFPKSNEEKLLSPLGELEAGQIIEIDIYEVSGFLRADLDDVQKLSVDGRRKKPNTDNKQEAIQKGQAFNLAFNWALQHNNLSLSQVKSNYSHILEWMNNCYDE